MSELTDALRAVIIDWLGAAYDAENRYPGNPDYRGPEDVDELVARLRPLYQGEHD